MNTGKGMLESEAVRDGDDPVIEMKEMHGHRQPVFGRHRSPGKRMPGGGAAASGQG